MEIKDTNKIIDNKKERNDFVKKIIETLASWKVILPIGQLAIFLHTANGLGIKLGESEDKAEKRNRDYFKSINPHLDDILIYTIINGRLKPATFIHPFEKYHSVPGYLDYGPLSEFFLTTDHLSQKYKKNVERQNKEEFLAFVYMTFLLIHPFIDYNGRVARNLLDYYNSALAFGIKPVWNNENPKFSEEPFHKKAFKKLFSEEVKIDKFKYKNIFSYKEISSLLRLRRLESIKIAEYIMQTSKHIKKEENFDSYIGIKIIANEIKKHAKKADGLISHCNERRNRRR